jgi:hypothetical protein
MTNSDIKLIEQELGISLPDSYRQAVCPFRIPALAGNTDYELWDDPNRLIELNRRLRAGSRTRPAWPLHLFAIGDPHGDELIAINTRSSDGPVWWLDHGCVDSKASYQSHSRFADWAEEFYRDMRSDMKGDDINPDGKPGAKSPFTLEYWLALVGMAIAVLLFLFALAWIRSWLKK